MLMVGWPVSKMQDFGFPGFGVYRNNFNAYEKSKVITRIFKYYLSNNFFSIL